MRNCEVVDTILSSRRHEPWTGRRLNCILTEITDLLTIPYRFERMPDRNPIEYFTLPSFVPAISSTQGRVCDAMSHGGLDADLALQLGADIVNRGNIDGVMLLRASLDQKETLEEITGIKLYENRLYEISDIYPLDLSSTADAVEEIDGAYEFKFVVEDEDGAPIPSVALTARFGKRVASPVYSDSNGIALIKLAVAIVPLIQIRPAQGYWPAELRGRKSSETVETITLTRIDLKKHERYIDLLGEPKLEDGKGVKVAIIDTGVAKHRDLPNVTKRLVVSQGAVLEDTLPDGIDHGTHVAGIIGCSNHAVLGHAPSAEIFSYRVCPPGTRNMKTIDLSVAIAHAVDAGADIINLSLGFDLSDDGIVDSINFAHDIGVLVVAASGNNSSCKVNFPANMPRVVAVSALGRIDAYPFGSTAQLQLAKDAQGEYFVAAFSNLAPGMIQCSAPGVGIVSTVLDDGYLAESGTSMAAPAVTALAATLLSRNLSKLGARTSERLKNLEEMLYTGCNRAGFSSDHVGHGIPSVR